MSENEFHIGDRVICDYAHLIYDDSLTPYDVVARQPTEEWATVEDGYKAWDFHNARAEVRDIWPMTGDYAGALQLVFKCGSVLLINRKFVRHASPLERLANEAP